MSGSAFAARVLHRMAMRCSMMARRQPRSLGARLRSVLAERGMDESWTTQPQLRRRPVARRGAVVRLDGNHRRWKGSPCAHTGNRMGVRGLSRRVGEVGGRCAASRGRRVRARHRPLLTAALGHDALMWANPCGGANLCARPHMALLRAVLQVHNCEQPHD